jgi:glycosyltransferase involved in cell wall biosynthesis
MDILFVARCLPPPPPTGDRVILDHLTRGLAARGHRLELLGFYLEGQGEPPPRDGRVFSLLEAHRERRRSTFDYLSRLPRLFPSSADQSWNPSMWQSIDRRIQARTFDIIHAFGGVQVYEFRNLLTRAAPTIITPYESYARSLERDVVRSSSPLLRPRLRLRLAGARLYERRMFAGYRRIVVLTEADAAYLRSLDPTLPTAVIPNGVGREYFESPLRRPTTPSMIFVGDLAYPPNLEAARELLRFILPLVSAAIPGARAAIIGPHPPPDLRSAEGDHIEVTGWVPDIRPHLERSACFVSPLRSGAGMRNKILEAMAVGVPVVATAESCEGIEVTDGEHVLLGRTPADLAAAAIHLMQDESLRRRIAEGGRRLMRQKYMWEAVVDRYEVLYRDVISESPRRETRSGG